MGERNEFEIQFLEFHLGNFSYAYACQSCGALVGGESGKGLHRLWHEKMKLRFKHLQRLSLRVNQVAIRSLGKR